MRFVCDIHTHTIASGHGTTCTITDMAKAAAARGLALLGISDHGPATAGAGTLSYFWGLTHAPRRRCGVRVLYGAEANILDYEGGLDLPDALLDRLDYVIASIHPQNLRPGSKEENTAAYIGAMRHAAVKVIGHPDDAQYEVDYDRLAEAAARYGVILELNNSSLSPQGYRGDARPLDRQMLAACRRYGLPILLSSDSHGPAHLGDFTWAAQLAEELQIPQENILNTSPERLCGALGIPATEERVQTGVVATSVIGRPCW